jgi:hypothetical protein
MPLFSKLLLDGTLDTVVHKTALTEMLNRVSFYPYQYNYDMFCDAVNETSLSTELALKRKQVCGVYDLNSLAIDDKCTININTNPNYKNSLILVDNNFYNIYSKTGEFFSVNSVELVGNKRPDYPRLVRIGIKKVDEEFLLLRPAFVFIPMIGLFSVVYDFNIQDNVMNFYDSEMKSRKLYLYIEPVNAESTVSKPILPTVTFSEQATELLASQLNNSKCTVFYLLQNNMFPAVAPISQACVVTFDIEIGTISQFDVGKINSPENIFIPSIKIIFSKQEGLQVLCKGSSIVLGLNKEKVISILSNYQVRKAIVTFTFNTVTIALFYVNPLTNMTGFFIFRDIATDTPLKDKLFALETNIKDINQMKVSYSLPNLVNIAKSINVDMAKI